MRFYFLTSWLVTRNTVGLFRRPRRLPRRRSRLYAVREGVCVAKVAVVDNGANDRRRRCRGQGNRPWIRGLHCWGKASQVNVSRCMAGRLPHLNITDENTRKRDPQSGTVHVNNTGM